MTNAVATKETEPTTTALAELDRESLLARALGDEQETPGYRFLPSRVQIDHRSRRFVDPNTGETWSNLTGVVLYSQITRGYWVEGDKRPRCSSLDGAQGTAASGQVLTCATCRQNRWGSAAPRTVNGQTVAAKGKACKEMRRLLFLPDGFDLPVLLAVPPSSLNRFDGWASGLRSRKLPVIAVRAALRLEEASNGVYSFARLTLEAGEPLNEDELRRALETRDRVVAAVQGIAVEAEDYSVDEFDAADDPWGAPAETVDTTAAEATAAR